MGGQGGQVSQITPTDLARRLKSDEPPVVLDVREHDERGLCAIAIPAGTTDLHIPMAEIPTRFADIRNAAVGRELVVYCHLGQRSMVVATWLAARGIPGVSNLTGGIDAWSVEVDPTLARY